LEGEARINFTVSHGNATGSITLGRARGNFRVRARGLPDGTYSIMDEVTPIGYPNVTEACACRDSY
jgi:hypothetical protein